MPDIRAVIMPSIGTSITRSITYVFYWLLALIIEYVKTTVR
jgi:hypothetical protein